MEDRSETLGRHALRIGAAACCLGWAWQHLYLGAPYTVLLWHANLVDIVEGKGIAWERYVANVASDQRVRRLGQGLGIVLLFVATVAATSRKATRWRSSVLLLGSLLLFLPAACHFVDAGGIHTAWIERGSQYLSPLILLLALGAGVRHIATRGLALLAFCMTFGGHGLYAVGWHPTPGHFFGMVSAILGLGEQGSAIFLKTVGALDLMVCVTVFLPKLRTPSLLYGMVWGGLTALARPLAACSTAADFWGLDLFLHETVLRLPHAAIPLFLLLSYRGGTTSNAPSP